MQALAEKALELDESLAEVHALLGRIILFRRRDLKDRNEARVFYQRALELNPNYAQAYRDYAEIEEGEAGLKLIRKAVELEPGDPDHRYMLVIALASTNRRDEADVQGESFLGRKCLIGKKIKKELDKPEGISHAKMV